MVSYDDILRSVGEFGRYQKLVYFLLCVPSLSISALLVVHVFILGVPKHRCKVPGYDNDTYWIQDGVHEMIINASIPLDENGHYDACAVYVTNNVTQTTGPCTEWVYDESVYGYNFAMQLNMVCEDAMRVPNTQMIFYLGFTLGSVIFGQMSDIIGRKKTFGISLVILLAASCALVFMQSYVGFCIMLFLMGGSGLGLYLSAYVMSMELVGPSKRIWSGNLVFMFFTSGILLLVLVVYLLPNWRYFTVILALPLCVSVPCYWFIPESCRWLLSKNRNEEAAVILKKMAKGNKTMFDPKCLDSFSSAGPTGRFCQLFSKRVLSLRTITLFFNWFVISMSYYGMMMNAGNLSGNLYINFALLTAVEYPAKLVSISLLDRIGRKKLHILFLLIGGAACIATIWPILDSTEGLQPLLIAMAMLGKLCSTGAFGTVYILSSELFPTVVRNVGMGASSASARVGTMLAPYIAQSVLCALGHEDMTDITNTLNQLVKQNKALQHQMSTITAGLTEMCRAVNIATCDCNQARETGPHVEEEHVRETGPDVKGEPAGETGPHVKEEPTRETGPHMKGEAAREAGPHVKRKPARETGPHVKEEPESTRVIGEHEDFKLLSLESHGEQNGTVQLTFKFEASDGYLSTWMQLFQKGNGYFRNQGVEKKTRLINNRYLYQSDLQLRDLQLTKTLYAMAHSTRYSASVAVNLTTIVVKGEHSIPEWKHRITEYPSRVVLPDIILDEFNITVPAERSVLELVEGSPRYQELLVISPIAHFTMINTTSEPASIDELYFFHGGLTISHVDNGSGDITLVFTIQEQCLENGGRLSLSLPHIGNEFIEEVQYGLTIDVVRKESMSFVPFGVTAVHSAVQNVYVASSFVSVRCYAMGNPSPDITVYKETKGQLKELQAETLIKDEIMAFKSVTVDELSMKDESFGTYVCRASNGYSTVQHRLTLQPYRSIKFDERKTGVTRNTTEKVVVTCKASGNPIPQLQIRLGWDYGTDLLAAEGNFTSQTKTKNGSSKVTMIFSPPDSRFDIVFCFAMQKDRQIYETDVKEIRMFPEDLNDDNWMFYQSFERH